MDIELTSRRSLAVVPVALLLASLGLAGGCSEDVEPRVYTVNVQASPTQLPTDGSESATVSILVLDQDNQPAAAGSLVQVYAVEAGAGGAVTSTFTGNFGDTGNTNINLNLDEVGSASVRFSCIGEVPQVYVIARLADTGDSGLGIVRCDEVITSDNVIETPLSVPARLRPGQQAVITAQVLDGRGDPFEAGERIVFEVDATTVGGFGSGRTESTVVETNAQGVATVNFLAAANVVQTGDEAPRAEITASFDREVLGAPSPRLVIRVSDRFPETSTVDATVTDEDLIADGRETTTVQVLVLDRDGVGRSVTARADCPEGDLRAGTGGGGGGGGGFQSNELRFTTDDNGQATLTYRAGTEAGLDVCDIFIAANQFDPEEDTEIVGEFFVNLFSVGGVRYDGATPDTLGILNSGVNPSAQVCFTVQDGSGNAFLEGYTVDFAIADATSAGATVAASRGQTDDEGQACVELRPGTTTGVITVRACISIGESEFCQTSDAIDVVGAIPSRANFNISCEETNLGGLRWLSGSQMRQPSNGERICTTCQASLIDRFGNPVGFSYSVNFAAEAGTFLGGSRVESANGLARVTWCAEGAIPADVEPFDEEPYWITEDGDILNPRDGLVTLIAYVQGEEEFVDRNENGRWDEGETFWDLPEPWIDANDNNDFDPVSGEDHERFIDRVGAGEGDHDGGNGEWDSNTLIWTATHLLVTGSPDFSFHEEVNTAAEINLDHVYENGSDGDGYPMSHWYIREADTGEFLAQVYAVDRADATCASSGGLVPNHCFDAMTIPYRYVVSDSNPPIVFGSVEIFWVARDMFGNPPNPSVVNYTQQWDTTTCSSSPFRSLQTDVAVPNDTRLPFDVDLIQLTSRQLQGGGFLTPYEVEISGFTTGLVQRFVLSAFRRNLPVAGCRWTNRAPLQGCQDCEDPVDNPPYPTFIMYQSTLWETEDPIR